MQGCGHLLQNHRWIFCRRSKTSKERFFFDRGKRASKMRPMILSIRLHTYIQDYMTEDHDFCYSKLTIVESQLKTVSADDLANMNQVPHNYIHWFRPDDHITDETLSYLRTSNIVVAIRWNIVGALITPKGMTKTETIHTFPKILCFVRSPHGAPSNIQQTCHALNRLFIWPYSQLPSQHIEQEIFLLLSTCCKHGSLHKDVDDRRSSSLQPQRVPTGYKRVW